MDGAPHQSDPGDKQTDNRGAIGRPVCAGHPTFGDVALQLLEQGFEPLPVRPGKKVPAVTRWSKTPIDAATIEKWCQKYPDYGVGLRTGRLVGLDIDISDDPDEAHGVQALAEERFGKTLMRVGQWPKRLLLYRTDTSFPKLKAGKVEILGLGQQFVAFGMHPDTGMPYYWPEGETPMDVELAELPVINEDMAKEFLAEAVVHASTGPRSGTSGRRHHGSSTGDIRRENGRVVDGRDGWLSRIAFHAVHDALDAGRDLNADALANLGWTGFAESADLERPRKDGNEPYAWHDARAKIVDKLRLHRVGQLPGRELPSMDVVELPDAVDPEAARRRLDNLIRNFCAGVTGWWMREPDNEGATAAPPRLGLRATVGLGKSTITRAVLPEMQRNLKQAGRPHRVLFVTPSHALAEEAAETWRAVGQNVAVLRGYERTDPATGAPMCRDIDAVRIAIQGGEKVPPTCCKRTLENKCRFFQGCLRKRNEVDVQHADIVLAPYDVLFLPGTSGLQDLALVVVDEGCWQRAYEVDASFTTENLRTALLSGRSSGHLGKVAQASMNANEAARRRRLIEAFEANPPGALRLSSLRDAGLTQEDCVEAVGFEARRLEGIGLRPAADGATRNRAAAIAARNDEARRLRRLWHRLERLFAEEVETAPDIQVLPPDPESGNRSIRIARRFELADTVAGLPILHLDATLRPRLAQAILPGMSCETIEAAAPHMHLTLVQGRFSKSAICPESAATEDDARARQRRLDEVVTHVDWRARVMAPGRTLIITHKSIETAFSGLPGVDVAHFNAIAGLDAYKDVAQLIVIGRPLPGSAALDIIAGGLFGEHIDGEYENKLIGLPMRSGKTASIRAIRHSNKTGELLRAAICDDEILQAIGRGRGVNRTAQTPLQVIVMADVALPLPHDRILHWEIERPDILQKMLLAGIATDSPGDAAALHPELFGNEKQAQKALERDGFKRQSPIGTYKEMSLKSAAYRRPGRGRGWQRAWWIDGDVDAARKTLETAMGPLAEWRPNAK